MAKGKSTQISKKEIQTKKCRRVNGGIKGKSTCMSSSRKANQPMRIVARAVSDSFYSFFRRHRMAFGRPSLNHPMPIIK